MKSDERIGIFGGSFNPIHWGHIDVISSLMEWYNLDSLYIVPCYISPFKVNQDIVSAEHRINMINLIFNNNSNIKIDTFEVDKKGTSYTVDMIKYFRQKYDNILLFVGEDHKSSLYNWKDIEEISKLSTICFIPRPKDSISSTEIRKRVKMKMTLNDLIPTEIEEYIKKNQLYSK